MASDYISPSDRDYAIRTMIGEAANQPDEGLAAVGHVIMNRARDGGYGGTTARDVVTARGQFEPWQTRGRELMGYTEDSPEYQRAATIFDQVQRGELPDNTGGATHFMNRDIVAQRNGGRIPQQWAQGNGLKIGDHTFYKPKSLNSDPGTALFDKYDPDKAPKDQGPPPDTRLFDKYDTAEAKPVAAKEEVKNITPQAVDPLGERAFLDRAVSSMPVIGPLADKAAAAAGAALQPLVGANRDKTFAERYQNNLTSAKDRYDTYGRDHPKASVAADVTGAGMVLGPMGATRAGASALGLTGTSLGAQVLKGGATMGALETGNQVLKGNDPREQGLFGPVPMAIAGGAGGPILGEAAAIAGNKLVEMRPPSSGPLRNTNSVTRNKLSEAVDAETPASIAAAREAHGSSGLMLDTNQATRDIAGGLADIPGQSKGEIRELLRQRSEAQPSRMRESLDKNTVPYVNTRDLVKSVEEARDTAAKPLYDAFRNTKIYPTPEIKALVPRLEASGAFKMADELAGISGKETTEKFFTGGPQKEFPTAETWDLVKRGLDRRISTALDSDDKTLARELLKLKSDMLTEVEKTPGGQVWKQARDTWAEHTEIVHQVEEGQKTWHRSTRVDDLAHELSGLSYAERAARQQGARDAVNEIMSNAVNGDTTARNRLLTESGRAKLELLFGDKKAGRLIKDLEAEVNVSKNTNEIVGGSPTGSKIQRANALMPEKREPGYWSNVDLTRPASYVPEWMHPSAIMEGVSSARHANSRDQLGKIMQVPMQSPAYDDLIAAMKAEGARRAAGSTAAAARGRAVSGATQATGPALGNRLSQPSNSEPKLEGSRL